MLSKYAVPDATSPCEVPGTVDWQSRVRANWYKLENGRPQSMVAPCQRCYNILYWITEGHAHVGCSLIVHGCRWP